MSLGGYQILDLQNVKFVNNTAQKIKGSYGALQSTKRVTLLSNIVIDGTEYKDTFIELKGSTFTGTCYGYTLTIDNQDNVKFSKIGG